MIIKLSNLNESNIAVRFSEYESLESVKLLAKKVKWVWVDCFTKLSIDFESYNFFKNNNLKTCLVSPELQGQESKIEKYRNQLINQNIVFDAVCCKLHNINKYQEEE